MKEYYFENDEFVIQNFHNKKTFASFLPGLAGKRGIPLWAFYVNRGQGIASFGLQDKNTQILGFNPAVTAYQRVGTDGFRTFVKIKGQVHELFTENNLDVKRVMRIKRSDFVIEEINNSLGFKYEVSYFGLPNENLAALVREVKITNLRDEQLELELLDGLSQLFPNKVSNNEFNNIGNLLRSWMEVYSLEKNIGFYRMRSSTKDSAEIKESVAGNFYVSSFAGKLVKPIVDSNIVFDYDTTKKFARGFEKNSIEELYKKEQVTANKIPVGFTGVKFKLKKGETKRINTVIGNTHSEELLVNMAKKITSSDYLDAKRKEAYDVIEDILSEVLTETNFPIFDEYIKQNYLDNLLRGGYPMILNGEDKNFVYHLYSRRHGDLERDYNFFTLAPEFYSQGNGSFRDVCQNRRNDVSLNPLVEDFNMKMFASFIQVDGYNPLSIDGSTFEIEDKEYVKELVNELFPEDKVMLNLLMEKFTPGRLINTISNLKISLSLTDNELFDKVFKHSKQNFEASFAEGYWIDHWTYILDLVENYKSIYPDLMHQKLYLDNDYSYFDSAIYVVPRDEKICLTDDGKIRRFGAILYDNEKIRQLSMNYHQSNWFKNEALETVKTNLFGKLFVLATNKLSHLDPSGMGLEMEADKPGWNDAMNGLPGLFGSGVSETIELKRVITFLLDNFDEKQDIEVPKEFILFVNGIISTLKENLNDFDYWNKINNYKEEFRAAVRLTTKGNQTMSASLIKEALSLYLEKINFALEKAYNFGQGIYPTYLIHKVTKFEHNMINGIPKIGTYGLRTVKPLEFHVRALPNYLEAPARAFKVMNGSKNEKLKMYGRIRKSDIYDHELNFYKTSEFLDKESNEIGRGRSFTKGWQERESNFLHMTYKYLLGMLKGGLYNEFFEEIKTNLVCFMDPNIYGRSILENSSFIASSINPDPEVRGQGFVARLSGSTAEMLSMWSLMMMGKTPFIFETKLKLNLKPLLSKEFFKEGKISFTFLGKTKVTYINSNNIDTFSEDFKIKNYEVDGIKMKEVIGKTALNIRNGLVKNIKVFF